MMMFDRLFYKISQSCNEKYYIKWDCLVCNITWIPTLKHCAPIKISTLSQSTKYRLSINYIFFLLLGWLMSVTPSHRP